MLRFAFRVVAASAAQTSAVSFSVTRAYKGPPPVLHLCATCRAVIKSPISCDVLRFAFRVVAASAAQTSAVSFSVTRAYKGPPPVIHL